MNNSKVSEHTGDDPVKSGNTVVENEDISISQRDQEAKSSRKRVHPGRMMSSSIHKPFRSPVRVTEGTLPKPSSASSSTKQYSLSGDPSSNRAIQSLHLKEKTLLLEAQPTLNQSLLPPSNLTTSRIPKLAGTRKPFRSPIVLGGNNAQQPRRNPYNSQIQIQALLSRITELQSSIRKARQIIQQQEKNDTPLEDLIEKWKKACQDGAQVLLERHISQEQFIGDSGVWVADVRSGFSLSTESSKGSGYSGFNDWRYSRTMPQDNNESQRLGSLDDCQIEEMEDNMEAQDLQYDLPTVEEAIHAKVRPDPIINCPRTMTKMERLLIQLGIDPTIIGYNAEQDSFTNEELHYESS
ncbi:hypothetical protein BGZ49_006099 [Haplosporangium sp. Z 27]|nr:hypothetical protein BGZ49_006099 [Haplosporangium sp. Z 27]